MRVLLYGAVLVLSLYALIDCILTPGPQARFLPKWLWLVVVVIAPVLGPVGWLLGGRPTRASVDAATPETVPSSRPPRRGRRGPVAPDDDPAFLRKLADDEGSRKMRERRERPDGPASP
ncbi:MAG TPA: PLD nuclease N-terminal domain-containing protein [Candidatus Nanopelagicales bacterium]|nr:PLD nuclease N-terminal domain-containing protein [Candidatus Nanopelagicales bacterium]